MPDFLFIQRSYMYTKLSDVKETNSVNVYGVVKFFKPPRKTRGTGMNLFKI